MINSSVLLSTFRACKTNRFAVVRIPSSRLLVPYFIFVYILFFSSFSVHAQFIPNWSFENSVSKPTSHSQFRNNVTDWLTLGTTSGTPDYFNTLGTYNLSGLSTPILPVNGTGFAGIYAEVNNSPTYSDYKEYITSHLSVPLVAGVTYTFSFYTAHVYGALVPGSPGSFAGTTDLPDAEQGFLGVVFSATQPAVINTGTGSPTQSQRYNSIRDDFNPLNRVLIPKTNTNVYGAASRNKWVFVSLKYTAKGGEEYMTVGQFRPGGTSLATNYSAYYLFDGFSSSVSPLDNCMEIGNFDVLGETSKTGISDLVGFAGGTTGWPANVPNGHMVIESKSKGFVITRVSSSAAIVNPVEGMLIYDIAAACVKLYNGTVWKCLAKDCI